MVPSLQPPVETIVMFMNPDNLKRSYSVDKEMMDGRYGQGPKLDTDGVAQPRWT